MSDNDKKKIDEIILGGQIIPKNKVPPVTSSDDDLKNILSMSEEEIEKIRKQKLEEIEKHILKLKKEINVDKMDEYVLNNKIELLERAKFMLNEYMITVISQLSSNPKAFDVLSQMFITVSDLNKSILETNQEQLNVKIENHQKNDDSQTLQNTTQLISKIMDMNYQNIKKNNKKVI